MEKSDNLSEKQKIKETLTLENRSNLRLEGVSEIVSSSETLINVKLKDTTLTINGQNLHINRIDINSGILEATGSIESIKYGKSVNLFKRIFK